MFENSIIKEIKKLKNRVANGEVENFQEELVKIINHYEQAKKHIHF